MALEIVGEGRERPRLQGLVRAMNEGHRIAFHGAADTDGVVNALARSHCCVSASNFETFGVTLIEAMASGLPVVATPIGRSGRHRYARMRLLGPSGRRACFG